MKILIFEYINGGGLSDTDLPQALAQEGSLMLNALLADFAALPEHEIFVLVDWRCIHLVKPQLAEHHHLIAVNAGDNVLAVFEQTLAECDAAWLIAPESEGILAHFTRQVEQCGKMLLSCPGTAVVQTADKLLTFQQLSAHTILTIPTQRLDLWQAAIEKISPAFPLVIKPRDGAGCENTFLIHHPSELTQILKLITQPARYIVQPFIAGESLSISAIISAEQAQLLCINRQHLRVANQQLALTACEVNIAVANPLEFTGILRRIAAAFPELFGYVGIDLLVTDNAIYTVEINPRLTSSYAGIKAALGINVAELLLRSQSQKAVQVNFQHHSVFIHFTQDASDVR